MSDCGRNALVQKAREAAPGRTATIPATLRGRRYGGSQSEPNGKGLGWPLIAEAPTEGWPLLVDTCFQFSDLARLLAGLFLLRGIAHLCWSLIVQQ